MSLDFKEIINYLAQGKTLSREMSRKTFEYMMNGDATGAQIGAFLMGLRIRGETVDEMTGAVEAMRSKALSISCSSWGSRFMTSAK